MMDINFEGRLALLAGFQSKIIKGGVSGNIEHPGE